MAIQAEDMSYEDLKGVVEGLCCRGIDPFTSVALSEGSFSLVTFPMSELEAADNPAVHYFDLIRDHPADVNFFDLSKALKSACEKKDLQLLPPPFGLQEASRKETTMQMVILNEGNGKVPILKHFSFTVDARGILRGPQSPVDDSKPKDRQEDSAVLPRKLGRSHLQMLRAHIASNPERM